MTDFTDRQKEIIDRSIQLISKGGIQGLTIKNISESIGISEPAIYRHFSSKMDILLGILSHFKNNTKSILERITSYEISAVKQLESIFFTHFRQFTAKPAMTAVIFSEEIFQNDKQLSKEVFSIMKLHQDAISVIIEKGQKNSEIRSDISKEQLSLIIMGSLRLIVTKWSLSNFSFDLEKEGANLWNSIKRLIVQ